MPEPLNGARPVDAETFARAMAALSPPSGRFALAISGGPDSMALAYCVARWRQNNNGLPPIAIIVDHALRPESAQEARDTADRLGTWGLDCRIVRWDHEKLSPHMHETARRARYKLLSDACASNNCAAILMAHHADDQAETILMRLAKGSGPAGLAGMPANGLFGQLRLLRPFLAVPGIGKAELIATCEAANIGYATDPSNLSEKYTRGRLRRLQPLLAAEGFSRDTLLLLGQRAAEAEDALSSTARTLMLAHSRIIAGGAVRIDLAALSHAPRGIVLRAVASAMNYVHRGDHPPSYAALSDLCTAVLSADAAGARSLAGCLIAKGPSSITVLREPSAIHNPVPFVPGETLLWDERWALRSSADFIVPPDCLIAPLYGANKPMVERLFPGLAHKIPQGRIRAGLPGLWKDGHLIAIPALPDFSVSHNPSFSASLVNRPFPMAGPSLQGQNPHALSAASSGPSFTAPIEQ